MDILQRPDRCRQETVWICAFWSCIGFVEIRLRKKTPHICPVGNDTPLSRSFVLP